MLSKERVELLSRKWNVNPHISAEWDTIIEQDILAFLLKQDRDSRELDSILPKHEDILNAFKYVEFSDVKAVIIGQDPYPGKDRKGVYHAHGLSFSSMSDDIPKSLQNIFKEIKDEYGYMNKCADLTPWTDQGVLLLNMNLTVIEGQPNNTPGNGWGIITNTVVRRLSERGQPIVFMLWGRKAQEVEFYIRKSRSVKILKAAHPSPMSADRGFFGCNHFIKCNDFLEKHGIEPIDWRT